MITTGQKQLPAGWKWVKLGEVTHISSGATPKSKVPNYWNGDICWVTPTDLSKLDGIDIHDSARKITQQGFDTCSVELVPKGSVVMSSRAPIGHLGIARRTLCTNQGCKTFVPGNAVDTEFLFYELKSLMHRIQALGTGSTFKEVSKSILSSFLIPLPPLEEQKRIADILNKAEEIKKLREEADKKTEDLIFGVLRDFAKGQIMKPMSEICEINPKKPSNIAVNENDAIPFIPMETVDEVKGQITEQRFRPYSEVMKGYTYFENGDILFAKITPCMQNGKHAIFEGNRFGFGFGFGSTEFHVVRPKIPIYREWIHTFLRSSEILSEAEKSFTGSAGQKRVPKRYLEEVKIPVPESQNIEKFSEIARSIKLVRENQIGTKEDIEELKSSLLQRAFRGEL